MNESERIRRLEFYRKFREHKIPTSRRVLRFESQMQASPIDVPVTSSLGILEQIRAQGFSTRLSMTLIRASLYLFASSSPVWRPQSFPIKTLADLSKAPDKDLLEIRNIGKKRLDELRSRFPYTGS